MKENITYISPNKVYVSVVARMEPSGSVTPLSLTWEDGRVYEIDDITDIRQAPSFRAGGNGLRYTVRIGRAVTHLWREGCLDKWFVERREYPVNLVINAED